MKLDVLLPLIVTITLYSKASFAKTLQCMCINYDECNYDYTPKGYSSDYHEMKTYEDSDQRPSCNNPIDVCCDLNKGNTNTDNYYHNISTTAKPSTKKWKCGYRGGKIDDSRCGTNVNAERGEFPWMVAVLKKGYYYNSPASYHCGGSLIHEKVVLTSAKEVHKLRASDLIVRAGAHNWKPKNGTHQDLKVNSIHIHPNFDPKSYINNCALLILAETAKFSANVNSICLASSKDDYEPANCIETGWGGDRDEINREGCYLKKSELHVINRKKCENIYRRTYRNDYYQIHNSVLCAGDDNYACPCTGTGGSPIVCPLKHDKRRYVQAGISSIATCHEPRKPCLYADVSHCCLPWINRLMKSHGFNSDSYKAE